MQPLLRLICTLLLSALSLPATAHTSDIKADYFIGTWQTSPEMKCGSANAEYMLIRKNGTFEYGRQNRPESVGFWRQEQHVIAFEMLAAPASFKDIIRELEPFTTHQAWSMQLMPTETDDNRFTAVFNFGSNMKSLTWQRCD